ncbi:MAG TPA: diguanylate cyclase [Nitrospiria bacterium]|nr:diguanylate cyclase [Nitrospiria bacterium]
MADLHGEHTTMLGWERRVSGLLHLLRLDHIKRKILVFSLLATLIPALSMGTLFYAYAKRFLTAKATQELNDVTAQNVRELDIWLKERIYEVRVFASSYEVSENLDAVTHQNTDRVRTEKALHRLNDYVSSVGDKFSDYEELSVLDANLRTVTSNTNRRNPVRLPQNWHRRVDSDVPIIEPSYRDQGLNRMVMLLAVPIKAHSGRFLGMMALKLNFNTVEEILGHSTLGKTGQIYLVAEDGAPIAGSKLNSTPLGTLKSPVTNASRSGTQLVFYADGQGHNVIGTMKRMTQLGWWVVAQIDEREIYAQIMEARLLTVAICAGLLLVIGMAAYLLGLTIVRPLDRLSLGAARVSSGDLEVQLPVVSRSEVGYLTEAFNAMVARLRQNQQELASVNAKLTENNRALDLLSRTDGLTGLYNRKHFMEVLSGEVAGAARRGRSFAVMMIDTDHFKKYNDTFGHLAGDALLQQIGQIIKQSLRSVDVAARYGGDEFITLLPEIDKEQVLAVAERIRSQVTTETLSRAVDGVVVTTSIGLAAYPEHGLTPEAMIASADQALYQAKESGRNRVVIACGHPQPT